MGVSRRNIAPPPRNPFWRTTIGRIRSRWPTSSSILSGISTGAPILAPWFAYTLAAIIQLTLLINVVAVGALVFIWMERKIAGRIQDRLGPTRVGGKFGWLQTLADGMKLITKEDLMPNGADGLLVSRSPPMSAFARRSPHIWPCRLLTTGSGMRLNVAVFFIIAVLGLEVFGVILAGYASASKWSLFGAMREAAQVVSYEVPLGMCVVVPVLIAGTMDLVTIGQKQQGLVHQLVRVSRSVHVHHLLGVFHLRHGQRESGPVRSGRGRKRTGGRLSYRILRPALELFLHGRVWLDVRRQRAGGHFVLRRLEWAVADHALAGRWPT